MLEDENGQDYVVLSSTYADIGIIFHPRASDSGRIADKAAIYGTATPDAVDKPTS